MKHETLLQRIKWKLWYWKLCLWNASHDRKLKHIRKRFCHYGIHKLRSGSTSWSGSDMPRTVIVRYLRCQWCDYKFFARKIDRNKYYTFLRKDCEHGQRFVSALLEATSSGGVGTHTPVGTASSGGVSTSVKKVK